ncbi:MAG: terminase family protein [Nannocystaceae bacterium]
MSALDREKKIELLGLLSKAKGESLARYSPSKKQKVFHDAGKRHRERAILAPNQSGKTWGAGREVAFHATGRYPDWWDGKRFKGPTNGWASGVTNETTRDNAQNILIGPPNSEADWGTGAIPKADLDIAGVSMSRACSNFVDQIRVRHVTGSYSTISFKSYSMGREKWQGPTLDWVWFDEEPPPDIYIEGLTRTNLGTDVRSEESGITLLSCTPLMGMSDVISMFYPEPATPSKHLTQMDIWDVEGILYTKQQIEAIIESYPDHERDARAHGIPSMGQGRCFPIDQKLIMEPAMEEIPKHWPRIAGIDLGWDHPTAVVWLALEPLADDSFIVHVLGCYSQTKTLISVHADAIRERGEWIPVAWPHDAHKNDPSSGMTMAEQYRRKGVAMLHEHATFQEGGNSVETGVQMMLDLMKTGRFKVAEHLHEWFSEFRLYHRAIPKGATVDRSPKIVKRNDDILDATRYALMMTRYAKLMRPRMFLTTPTVGMDYDPFNPGGDTAQNPNEYLQ